MCVVVEVVQNGSLDFWCCYCAAEGGWVRGREIEGKIWCEKVHNK
jgi:hypothetical protein